MNNRIRTVIFDDDEIDVRGICDILKGIPEIAVVGKFDVMGEALVRCRELQPDLIIVDADIRDDKNVGPNFVRNVLRQQPQIKLLGLTKWPDCVLSLKRAGCHEAVLKQFFDDEKAALKFIRETLMEKSFFMKEEPPQLSEDEDKVVRMVASGCTENEISDKLNKTRKQVRNIKLTLKSKFGASTGRDPELVALAYRKGYFRPDDELESC
jgi:two-component system, NarL family, invasion response regulator UvrY